MTKLQPAGPLVSSPDPDSQQLRVDYITATWKVGLGNKNDALVPSVPQCLCPKIVRQSKFRTNLSLILNNYDRMTNITRASLSHTKRSEEEDLITLINELVQCKAFN